MNIGRSPPVGRQSRTPLYDDTNGAMNLQNIAIFNRMKMKKRGAEINRMLESGGSPLALPSSINPHQTQQINCDELQNEEREESESFPSKYLTPAKYEEWEGRMDDRGRGENQGHNLVGTFSSLLDDVEEGLEFQESSISLCDKSSPCLFLQGVDIFRRDASLDGIVPPSPSIPFIPMNTTAGVDSDININRSNRAETEGCNTYSELERSADGEGFTCMGFAAFDPADMFKECFDGERLSGGSEDFKSGGITLLYY